MAAWKFHFFYMCLKQEESITLDCVFDIKLETTMKPIALIVSSLLPLIANTGHAKFCPSWSQAKQLGFLDPIQLSQASGIAHSEKDFNRLFHVNENDGPFIYTTDLQGKDPTRIKVLKYNPKDMEDLAYGSCGNLHTTEKNAKCLIIGDIGDNYQDRKDPLQLVFVEDTKILGDTMEPLGVINMSYPNNEKYDAEGIAMHPNGDFYLLTKSGTITDRTVGQSKVFRLARSKWEKFPKETLTLEHIGNFDFNYLLFEDGFWGRQITGIDISPDGKSLLAVTYKNAIEIHVDLSQQAIKKSSELKENIDYHIIKLKHLPKQEAITYLRGTDRETLVYSTAFHGPNAELMAVFCNTARAN